VLVFDIDEASHEHLGLTGKGHPMGTYGSKDFNLYRLRLMCPNLDIQTDLDM
jgi:hypothetical protein